MMGDDVFYEHMYAMRAKVDKNERACQYFAAENHKLADQAQSLIKRLHDKNDSVTKLKERVSMVVKNCDAMEASSRRWYDKYKDAEEWRDYWKKGYFELYAEFQDQVKALSEANEKLNRLAETEKPEVPTWRGRYWKVVGKLAARRDECKYLVEQNEGLKAKVKELEEGAVVAQGGYDNLVLMGKNQMRDLNYWRDACEKSDTIRRDLLKKNEGLQAQLNGISEKNIEILKTERIMNDLVEECREARGSLGIKMDRIAFLEELARSLYGEGWSKLTIVDAQDHRSGNKYKLGVLRSRVKQLEAQALRRKLKASQ